MRYTVVGTASYGRLFLPITLSEERKNLQEIHFKPPDQARRPTFALIKPNRERLGTKPGKRYKRKIAGCKKERKHSL